MSATDKLDQIDKRHGAWFHSEPDTAKWSPTAYFAGSRATDAEMSSEIVRNDVPALRAALRAALEVTSDSLAKYPDDITALAVNRAIEEKLS